MSLEKENQVIPSSPTVEKYTNKKLTYDRELLLSLSKLEVCKKLPHGFDASILSEFADAPNSTYERRPLSQNRLESSGGYVRGSQGRWDTRSTGSSDKDGELQSDREPLVQDTGRRFGNQTRRFGPNTEHDGLLGSGAFPRPSGHTGTSATKDQGNGQYHLSRSTVPYQPPRPYKAAPYSRKDITDSHNDETFGSDECSSVDRAEEERKRRASFELMRKEQHKALQEKHTSNPQTCKENLDVDLFAMLANSADGKVSRSENKPDESVAASLSYNDSSRSSFHIQAPTSRPLVPPGFASALMEKNISVSSSSASRTLEAGSGLVETDHSLYDIEINQDKRNSSAALTHVNLGENKADSVSVLFGGANENLVAQASNGEVLRQEVGSGNVSGKTTGIQAAIEVWEDNINNDLPHRKASTSNMMNTASLDNSTTVLEKLFSSALSKTSGSSPNAIEHPDVKVDGESWGTDLSKSSKFAHWFPEEEKKSIEDFSSRGLLSLVSNDKIASRVSTSPNEKAIEIIPSGLPSENIEIAPKLPMSLPISSTFRMSEQYSQIDKKTPTPSSAVLTCEDLEQSILAEVTYSSPRAQPTIQGSWTALDGNSIEKKVDVDNHASQHILSLLQKGTSSKESVSSPGPDIFESSDRIAASNINSGLNPISDNAVDRNPEIVDSPEKSITLEALFGSAFMNALHSAEAPVSAKTSSVETVSDTDLMQPHRPPLSHANDGFFSSTSIESRSNRTIREGDMLSFNNPRKNPDVSVPTVGPIEGSNLHDMGIEEGEAADIQLPEEDGLITIGDTLNPVISDPFSFENAHKSELLRGNPVENLNDRLLNAIVRDGELRTHVPEGPPPLHNGPFEMVDPDNLYHHLHGRPSSQYPHQMNQTRPLFPPLDHIAQRNGQMKFMGPDGFRRDPHLPFPGNSMPHHGFRNVGAPRFDPAIAHHPMLQHMPVPGNFPPHHSIQGLLRGVSPSHPINHMPGYMPGMNDMHFPMHHRQPNLGGGLGLGLPGSVGPGNGSHHPEALERLIEMEMRARSKQTHPGGHIPGIPGTHTPELDMNFRFR